MPMPTDLRGRSLLAVFAHPDDESIACGGLLAWCAHLGADVSLLCMTRGEHGRGATAGSGEHAESTRDVGRRRRRELDTAARALGIGTVTLLDHEDGMLPWLPAVAMREKVEAEIRARRPEVVVTFDADGLYWHPDHIAVHELTTAAVMGLGDAAPALYYVTIPPGSMRAVADHALATSRRPAGSTSATGGPDGDRDSATSGAGHHPHHPRARRPATSILGVEDPDAFGSAAPAPTLVVDASAFAARKLAALACHGSQFRGSALAFIAEDDAPRLLGLEHYRRSAAGTTGPTFLDDLGTCPESLEAPHRGPRRGTRPAAGA